MVAQYLNFQEEAENLIKGFVSKQGAALIYAEDKYLGDALQFFLVLQTLKNAFEYFVNAFMRNIDLRFCKGDMLIYQENDKIVNFAHFQEEVYDMLKN